MFQPIAAEDLEKIKLPQQIHGDDEDDADQQEFARTSAELLVV